jgi:hypothetical protein
MADEDVELDRLQGSYQAAVEIWIAAIRAEEEFASVPPFCGANRHLGEYAFRGRRCTPTSGGRQNGIRGCVEVALLRYPVTQLK